MNMILAGDYRDAPLELFDGYEPEHFSFDPLGFGLDRYSSVDLVAASIRSEELAEFPSETRAAIFELAPQRVTALNKSSMKPESSRACYAISRPAEGSGLLVIHYSFFEVSPLRYHIWLHTLIEVREQDHCHPR
jgi:hypothetical protein